VVDDVKENTPAFFIEGKDTVGILLVWIIDDDSDQEGRVVSKSVGICAMGV
jgi:hypothetical protein